MRNIKHIGAVGAVSYALEVRPVLTPAQYASGDVLAETLPVVNAVRVDEGSGVIQSVVVLDKAAQAQALDIVFLKRDVPVGEANSATIALTDENAEAVLGIVEVAAADYVDLTGNQVATKTNVGLVVEAEAKSRDLYLAVISRGTGTYAVDDMVLKIGILQD